MAAWGRQSGLLSMGMRGPSIPMWCWLGSSRGLVTQVGKLRQERASLAKIILHVGRIETLSLDAPSRSLSPPQQPSACGGGSSQDGGAPGSGGQGRLSSPVSLHTSRFLPSPPPRTLSSPVGLNQPSTSLGQAWKAVSAQAWSQWN